jgi:tetraacyldisaccharide 4'-kinase
VKPPSGGLAAALSPLGRLYLRAALLRNRLYDRGTFASHAAGAPVVSVGNLVAGGTGKTPLTAWLAARFLERGRRVALVSRGYGGRRSEEVTVVWQDGKLLSDAEAAGDEPVLLGRLVPGAAVVVGADRVRAARHAVGTLGADLLLLDDGFQHRRLARDCDVLLLAAADPFGGGRGLPAGLLRESPAEALARAHLLVLTGSLSPPPQIEERLRRMAPGLPLFRERHAPTALVALDGRPRAEPSALEGRAVFAVAGLARPSALRETLESLGARVVGYRDLPDHHRFRPGEEASLLAQADEAGAELLLLSEKDAVRWQAPESDGPEILALRVEARLDDPEGFLEAVLGRLETADG